MTVSQTGEVEHNTSGRISSIVERYAEVVVKHCPEFSLNEWCAICDANNGIVFDDFASGPTLLWANIYDTPGIGEKWSMDAEALIKKMQNLLYAESISIAEVVQRFWAATSHTNNREWLITCGAKISL